MNIHKLHCVISSESYRSIAVGDEAIDETRHDIISLLTLLEVNPRIILAFRYLPRFAR